MLRLAAGIVALLASLPCFSQSVIQQPVQLPEPKIQVYPRDLQILFTNYLLGYYRIPDVQASDFQEDCGDTPAPLTKELLDAIEDYRKSGKKTVLVGMGDNYAVEFGSRTYQFNGSLHPKLRVPQSPSTKTLIPGANWPPSFVAGKIADNVNCFLYRARYDALVPGKEDFYFGAERLRLLARHLAAMPVTEKTAPVHTLAANLAIQTQYWKKPAKIMDAEKKLPYQSNLPKDVEAVNLSDHDSVLPFFTTVVLKADTVPSPPPYRCEAPVGHADDLFDGKTCRNRMDMNLLGMKVDKNSDPKKPTIFYVYKFASPLQADKSYGFCMDQTSASKKNKSASSEDSPGPHCLRFDVLEPFFQAPACTSDSCYDLPYVFLPDRNAVIFGVVDPDLRSYVGRDNMAWQNAADPTGLKTELTVIDPANALKQARDSFCDQHPVQCSDNKLTWILLAQMDHDKAQELAIHTGFDVVFAKGTEFLHATSNRTVIMGADPGAIGSSRANAFPATVIVPWKGSDDAYDGGPPLRELVNPLRALSLTDVEGGRTLDLKGEYGPMDTGRSKSNLLDQKAALLKGYDETACKFLDENLGDSACKSTNLSEFASVAKPFQTAVLKILRDSTNADVALMQKRDFYFGPFTAISHGAPEVIERILWKGDFVQLLTVTGATLTKVLAESDQFDQNEGQVTRFTSEQGRALITFGLAKTNDDTYLVDGKPIDAGRLYRIAATNHLTAGDTGYPELNDPDLTDPGLPVPPTEEGGKYEAGVGRRLGELVCKWMLSSGEVCLPSYSSLFASATAQPFSVKPGVGQEVHAWIHKSFNEPTLEKQLDTAQDDVQNRPTTRISLKEFSADLSRARNNLPEDRRAQTIAGVSEPSAGSPGSHSIDFSTTGEWRRSAPSWDTFTRAHLEYQVNATSTTDTIVQGGHNKIVPAPATVSRSKNRAVVDAGFFLHPFWKHKSDPLVGIVLEPFRFDTPLHHEVVGVDSHFGANGTIDRPSFNLELERTRKFLSRIGFRVESGDSHLELGLQGGWERNALDALIFNSGHCDLLATKSLHDCLAGLGPPFDPSTIVQVRDTRRRDGAYADIDVSLPLYHKWKWVNQDQGEWFGYAHNDNSTDTLYRNDWTTKLSMPLFSNFTFEPGVEMFAYENKVGHTHLLRVTPMLKVNYNFDWYSGGSWKKSLIHKPGGSSD